MNQLRYYIDDRKIAEKRETLGIEIRAHEPSIKNADGFYGDVGIDIFAPYSFVVEPWCKKVVDTFIGFLWDVGTWAEIRARGGDDFLVGSGIIDTGYTGTVKVKIINPYSTAMVFNMGDSIGQIIVGVRAYIEGPRLTKVQQSLITMLNTERGDSGRINSQFSL